MSEIRLYNCPNCDAFIEEDVYHEHAADCKPWPLICEMTDYQLETMLRERYAKDYDWWQIHERVREVAQRAVEAWEQSNRQMRPMIAAEAVHAFVPEHAPKPPIDHSYNSIVLKLHPHLKTEEAEALIIEQLYELTRRDDLRL
jgi:hypothetical protein